VSQVFGTYPTAGTFGSSKIARIIIKKTRWSHISQKEWIVGFGTLQGGVK